MADRVRPYLFYDVTVSICATCFRKVEGKTLFENGNVYLTKHCPEHGREKVLIATDIPYYKQCREVFLKPPEQANRYNTPTRFGCPYDCGLCPDHEQHSCISLIEITDHCNLKCPICYADSGPHRPGYRTMEEIERMLDAIVANEGQPDIVQISGGEPTLHPHFFEILDACRKRPIKHLMVNTNGLRVAQDPDFVKRLADYMPGFELYLQFDSFDMNPLMSLRGADLRRTRERAIANLNQYNVSTTLVVTLKKGLNDHEVGKIIDYAVKQPCVRGVTLQPIQAAGRLEDFDPSKDRLTLTEVRQSILNQTSIFSAYDVIPVPCHPDSLAMAYAVKTENGVVPLTRFIDKSLLIEGARNTIVYERDSVLREELFKLFSTGHSPDSAAKSLRDLLCCLPDVQTPAQIRYDQIFRVLIVQFIDAHSFDLRSIKKTCVHIAQPDGRLIPFDTFNIFYRDDLEKTRLEPLRRAVETANAAFASASTGRTLHE